MSVLHSIMTVSGIFVFACVVVYFMHRTPDPNAWMKSRKVRECGMAFRGHKWEVLSARYWDGFPMDPFDPESMSVRLACIHCKGKKSGYWSGKEARDVRKIARAENADTHLVTLVNEQMPDPVRRVCPTCGEPSCCCDLPTWDELEPEK